MKVSPSILAAFLATGMLFSCAAVESARDKLATMPEPDYQELRLKVEDAGRKGGVKLKELLGEKTEIALDVTTELLVAVDTDKLDVADVIKGVVNKYGDRLGLEDKHLDYVRDGAKVIDAAVGQIRLGIDGKLTEREKGLVIALLAGLHTGLQ